MHMAYTLGPPWAPRRARPAQPSMSPQGARPQPGAAAATSCFPWERPLAGRSHGFRVQASPLGDSPTEPPEGARPPQEPWELGAAESRGRSTQWNIRINKFSCETYALHKIIKIMGMIDFLKPGPLKT